jgi:hypothetical protein
MLITKLFNLSAYVVDPNNYIILQYFLFDVLKIVGNLASFAIVYLLNSNLCIQYKFYSQIY